MNIWLSIYLGINNNVNAIKTTGDIDMSELHPVEEEMIAMELEDEIKYHQKKMWEAYIKLIDHNVMIGLGGEDLQMRLRVSDVLYADLSTYL